MTRGLVGGVWLLLAAALVVGCATPATSGAGPQPTTSSPVPTAACPEQPGVDLPPECAPYDPDRAMAQNDLYRERIGVDAETQAAGQALVAPVRAALEELRAAGEPLSEAAVGEALASAGVREVPQTRAAAGDVLFGVAVGGGCLYGAVTPEAVSVEVGGFIMDGGCLPAQ